MGAKFGKWTESGMFDTMTLTKIGGGIFGSLLVYMLGGWLAETIYHHEVGGHGEGEHQQAYVIEVEGGADEVSDEPAEDPVALFAAAWAVADPVAGEGEFRPCAACHALEAGKNGAGPYLHGVVGRQVASAEGFNGYSGELDKYAEAWTPENLNLFLLNPDEFAPDNAMNFGGMDDAQERANLIAYLATYGG